MADSIIKGVLEEVGELVKDTGKEVLVKQPKEAVKSIFPEIINSTGMTPMSPEEQAKKTAEEEAKKARLRRILHGQQQAPPTTEQLTPYKEREREDTLKKQQQAKMLGEQQRKELRPTPSREKRGSAFIVQKRKEAHVEMGKTPGQ